MPPATSEIAEALCALQETFESLGLRWYVFGAQAAILYGSSRMTEDVDVTVELGAVARTKQVLADLAEVLEDPDLVSRCDAVIRRAR